MTARRRTQEGFGRAVGSTPKNTVSSRSDAATQARPVRNTVNQPKAKGYSKVRGTVSG